MALIKCPECQKEISDKVKSCPSCGYPFNEDTDETQKVELSSVNIKLDKAKKNKVIKIISLVIIICLIIGGGYYFITAQNKKNIVEEFKNNIMIMKLDMISSGAEAEELLNLTSKVWANAIYEDDDVETNKFTKPNGYFVSDFNTALQNLFSDEEIKVTIQNIKNEQDDVAEIIKSLNNPPDEYEAIYEIAMEMYSAYQSITDLAINPQGNLQSFNDNKRERIDKFMDLYNKIEARMPV